MILLHKAPWCRPERSVKAGRRYGPPAFGLVPSYNEILRFAQNDTWGVPV